MRVIFYLKGLPGSGKSTEALKMLKEFPGRYRRVNKDSIRTMMIGPDFNFKTESMVVDIRNYAMEIALRKGFDIICDDTNLREKYYIETCNVAKRVGDVQIVEKYFECPLETCLERNRNRAAKVPEDLIIKMHEKYIKGKTVRQGTEYFPKVERTFERNPNLPDAIICDIDGTLALNQNGRSYYDSTRVIEDSVNVPVADIVRLYSKQGVFIIIVSGRKDDCRIDTETWLKCNDIPYNILLMRSVEDNRKDTITKKEIYDNNIKDKYNVLFVLDDRAAVVSGWRELGHTCLQVNDGNF
jgi:predicted kinase